MSSTRRRWLAEDELRIVDMRTRGASGNEMAAALGRTRAQVQAQITKMIRRGTIKSMPPSERSRRAGVTTQATRPDRWTEEQERRLVAMWNEGKTAREIAPTLGRSVGTTSVQLVKLRKRGLVGYLSRDQRSAREQRTRLARTFDARLAARELLARCPRNRDFGYLVGVMYGDGFVHTSRMSMCLKTTNSSFAQAFAQVLESCFGELSTST